jgi:hypothetical protein
MEAAPAPPPQEGVELISNAWIHVISTAKRSVIVILELLPCAISEQAVIGSESAGHERGEIEGMVSARTSLRACSSSNIRF